MTVEWSSDAPTVPGLYVAWVRENCFASPQVVEVYERGDGVLHAETDGKLPESVSIPDVGPCLWVGPIVEKNR